MKFNPTKIRKDFPILSKKINKHPLVYLDNAATTQKPFVVIESLNEYYTTHNANVHRGTYTLTEEATNAFENARKIVCQTISARKPLECIFVKGTTEGINLIANAWTHQFLKPDDEILITHMEHHSNIVPWQLACHYTKAKLTIVNSFDNGELDLNDFKRKLNERTKLVAITHVSNVLGTINPIKELIALAHANGTAVLIDGAQAAGHIPVNVTDLDCDFYAFSGHKVYGPTGIGILYGKEDWLEKLVPYQGGGEMIRRVTFEKTEYNTLPYKFEAGTPPIGPAVGLGTALTYLNAIGIEHVQVHEYGLLTHAVQQLNDIPEIRIIGQANEKIGIISFVVEGIHPHDMSTYLDKQGIAVRAGQLCAEPLLTRYNIKSLLRASFGLYNTTDEIDYFVTQLKNGIRFFKG